MDSLFCLFFTFLSNVNTQWQMPVPYGSKLDIPATKYYLLDAQKEPYKKVYSLTKNIDEFYGGPMGKWGGGGGGGGRKMDH